MFRIACLLLVLASSAPVWSQSDEPAVQTWNEILLEAIRNDLARPNVHARNLHHFSTGQYALQLLSEGLDGTAVDDAVAWPDAPDGIGTWSPGTTGHRDMMAALAFRFISLRYAASPDWGETLGLLVNAFIDATGTIPNNLLNSSEAAAYGNSVAEAINTAYLTDGANQQGNYVNTCYEPVNDPLDVTEEGLCTFMLEDPNRWQPSPSVAASWTRPATKRSRTSCPSAAPIGATSPRLPSRRAMRVTSSATGVPTRVLRSRPAFVVG